MGQLLLIDWIANTNQILKTSTRENKAKFKQDTFFLGLKYLKYLEVVVAVAVLQSS